MKKWVAITVGCIGALLSIWWLAAQWQLRDHFPHRKLNQLQTSMDTNAVAELLGRPEFEFMRTNSDGHAYKEWSYGAGLFQSVRIDFTPDGHFHRHRIKD
jgi:hypothetical protein